MNAIKLALILIFTSHMAIAEPTHRIFVTNEGSDSVSVIDASTNKVISTIDIGKRPRGIGMAPDGSEVYVAVSKENVIAVFDPRTLEILRRFNSGEDPEAFAVHTNGNIYISNEEDAKASVYNPKTGELVAEIKVGIEPEGVAISPDGSKVIVTSESNNMLHLISIPEHVIIANILVGARPRAVTFNADGSVAYATSEISGEIKKIDVASTKVVGHMPLADDQAKPKDIVVSVDGKRIYVAGGRANRVFVLDADTLEIIKSIPVGKRVWGLAMTRDGTRVYSTDGASHQVSVIDTGKNEVVATIPVGQFPWGLAIDD